MANAGKGKRKGLESEYFHRKEQELLEKARQRLTSEMRERLKSISFMRCPKCGEELEEIVFQGIQIDRCPECHGVWLDSGELERVTVQETQSWLAYFWRSSTGH